MSDVEVYRAEARRIAKQLGYDRDTLTAIRKAKTEGEISNIMLNARHKLKSF